MTSVNSLAQTRKLFQEGIDRGIEWLLSQQNADGSMNGSDKGLSTFYKTPLAFASRGEVEAAARLLQWIDTADQQESGDFGGSNGRGMMEYSASYPNAWITCGAQKAGMFGVSYDAMEYILTLQDPESGGFFRVLPDTKPLTRMSSSGVYEGGVSPGGQDVLSASMSGLACLLTGHIDAAKRAGAFVHTVLGAQPDPQNRFYVQWRAGEGLITEFPDTEQVPYVIDSTSEGQNYFQFGIAAAFLSRLHQVECESGHLGAAKAYLDVLAGYAADRYSIGKAGKVGWGAAYVYRLSGDQKYLDIALEVGNALLNLQGESGAWMEPYPINAQVEVTSEFVTLLSEMQEAFAQS